MDGIEPTGSDRVGSSKAAAGAASNSELRACCSRRNALKLLCSSFGVLATPVLKTRLAKRVNLGALAAVATSAAPSSSPKVSMSRCDRPPSMRICWP
jgi:hypothetical protein